MAKEKTETAALVKGVLTIKNSSLTAKDWPTKINIASLAIDMNGMTKDELQTWAGRSLRIAWQNRVRSQGYDFCKSFSGQAVTVTAQEIMEAREPRSAKRTAFFNQIDAQLKAGILTPELAGQIKANYDKMNSEEEN